MEMMKKIYILLVFTVLSLVGCQSSYDADYLYIEKEAVELKQDGESKETKNKQEKYNRALYISPKWTTKRGHSVIDSSALSYLGNSVNPISDSGAQLAMVQ
jgi:hypothetical protein